MSIGEKVMGIVSSPILGLEGGLKEVCLHDGATPAAF